MHNWFECKVSYEKMLENGMQKKVTEPYLVDALSFTEAEARIIEEIRPFITGEFTVTDIKRARLSELFFTRMVIGSIRSRFILSRWTRRAERKRKPPHKCLPKPLR